MHMNTSILSRAINNRISCDSFVKKKQQRWNKVICLFVYLAGRSIDWSCFQSNTHTQFVTIQNTVLSYLMNSELNWIEFTKQSLGLCMCVWVFALVFYLLCPCYKFAAIVQNFIVTFYLITGPNKEDHAKWRRSGKSSTSCTNHNLYPFSKKQTHTQIYMCECTAIEWTQYAWIRVNTSQYKHSGSRTCARVFECFTYNIKSK